MKTFFVSLILCFMFVPISLARENSKSRPKASFSRLTYDLGFAAGSYNNKNYSELNLGLNFFAYDWLAWRNAFFGRFGDFDTIYGLDSSLRFIYHGDFSEIFKATLFGGPGYRFANRGTSAPFAEAGVVFKLAGINLGGGVKTLFNSMVDSKLQNDNIYFIIISGSGSL